MEELRTGTAYFGWVVAAGLGFAAGCDSGSGPSPMPSGGTQTTTTTTVPPQTARYLVTFQARWSAATHPDEIPPRPHFSPLIR
jgi:hypothetical protein